VSQGNALFALELGRSVRGGVPAGNPDMILPASVEDALGARAVALVPGVRRLLLAVALTGGLTREMLEAVAGRAAVDAAFDDGVLVRDESRVRASHPLLAAAAVDQSGPRERRAVHVAIAGAVADEELSALHLALATDRPDDRLAARLTAAASRASSRGARPPAVVLAEHALRLTPAHAAERHERLLTVAAYLHLAGELQRLTDVLGPAAGGLPGGTARARAWLLLSEGIAATNLAEYERLLDRALAEEHVDAGVRAQALAKKTTATAVIAVRRVPEAEQWAREALATARGVGAAVEQHLLYSLSWATALRGLPVDDLCARAAALSPEPIYLVASPERVAAQRAVWRGELGPARSALARLLQLADDRGEASSYALHRLHLCELELRAGDWGAAGRLLDEWAESAERELLDLPMYERCRALLDTVRRRRRRFHSASGRDERRRPGGAVRRCHGRSRRDAPVPDRTGTVGWVGVAAAGPDRREHRGHPVRRYLVPGRRRRGRPGVPHPPNHPWGRGLGDLGAARRRLHLGTFRHPSSRRLRRRRGTRGGGCRRRWTATATPQGLALRRAVRPVDRPTRPVARCGAARDSTDDWLAR
jgi:hypothetical protein